LSGDEIGGAHLFKILTEIPVAGIKQLRLL
jgi:hypothetical protein